MRNNSAEDAFAPEVMKVMNQTGLWDGPIYPTPPLRQDMTQGQFLSRI